jgi:hypothetical protein
VIRALCTNVLRVLPKYVFLNRKCYTWFDFLSN